MYCHLDCRTKQLLPCIPLMKFKVLYLSLNHRVTILMAVVVIVKINKFTLWNLHIKENIHRLEGYKEQKKRCQIFV